MSVTERAPTAPIAALGLVAGFAVAVATGSRPLGGIVLALCGTCCIAVWLRRDGRRIALWLTLAGLFAFALSHVLGLVIGPWPAVALVAIATAGLCWRVSDAHRGSPADAGPGAPGSDRKPELADRERRTVGSGQDGAPKRRRVVG